ncbi:MAG: aminoacyl-tRNA hydrolase [Lachnospiraceae bacterium]|nr:aminoacyl-tRNA hydrolase [Lachnospiraceae bacterium]
MYIIVGLGNPGREYDNTRHNIGFATIDRIAEKENIDVSEKKHKALTGRGYIEGQRVILAKPQTFMNLSGESVKQIVDYYKADEKNELIVIVDDISLDAGHIRVRKRGSAGGHNGLKSIIAQLGHDNFVRIKIGIGEKPEEYNLADYVLGHFSADERKLMEEASESAYNALRMIITEDAEAAMNSFNRKNIL